MKSRRAISATILIAVLASAALWLRHPREDPAALRAAILNRHIRAVDMDGPTLPEACRMIADQTGVPIDVDATLKPEDRGVRFWCEFKDVSVAQLLDAMIDWVRIKGRGAQLEYDVKGDRIVIGYAANMNRRTRLYDLRDLPDGMTCDRHLQWMATVFNSRTSLVAARYWERECVETGEGHVLVLGTPATQDRFAQRLQMLRNAKSDGSGPSMGRANILDDVTTIERAYDVRDLVPYVHYPRTDTIPEVDGIAAIGTAMTREIRYITSSFVMTTSGRLLINARPADQDNVRELLKKLRAGIPAGGVTVSPKHVQAAGTPVPGPKRKTMKRRGRRFYARRLTAPSSPSRQASSASAPAG